MALDDINRIWEVRRVFDASFLTSAQLQTIAVRHGLKALPPDVRSAAGAANTVYFLSDAVVLRVPHQTTDAASAFDNELTVLPVACQAGVRTSRLLASDVVPDSPGTPYMLLERVAGENLGFLGLAPAQTPEVYRNLGRDLARWHLRSIPEPDPLAHLPRDDHVDPRPGIAALATQGVVSVEAAPWVLAWLDRLAPQAARPLTRRVVHGDARPTNLLVTGDPLAYRALLDWGDAHWADPASEFALMPLRAVPFALAGYRDERPDAGDEVNEERVLWYQLSWAVLSLSRSPTTEPTWSAPPAGRLLELFRFFVEVQDARWSALAP